MPLDLLFTDVGAVILFVLLIVAFIFAFKVMQMVFETILVSIISGAFYVSLVYLFDFPFVAERILLFAFLGATLYMLYGFLATMYSLASRLIGIPYRILIVLSKIPVYLAKESYSYLKDKYWDYRINRQKEKSENDREEDEDEKDVKNVVLDKVKEENE